MPKLILLANIKQHVKLEIAMYAKKTHQYNCVSNFLNLLNLMLHLFTLTGGSMQFVSHVT